MKYTLTLFCITFFLHIHSYEFTASFPTLSAGYKQGKIHTQIQEKENFYFFQEKIDDLKEVLFAIDSNMQLSSWFMELHFDLAYGSSHNTHIQYQAPLDIDPFAATALFALAPTMHSFCCSGQMNIGYSYRITAIKLQPKIGFNYHDIALKRENIYADSITTLTPQKIINSLVLPNKDLSYKWYTPLIGINMLFLIDPYSPLQFSLSYEYLFGPTKYKTTYYYDEIIIQRNAIRYLDMQEELIAKKWGDGHIVHLRLHLGCSSHFFLRLGFAYETRKIFKNTVNNTFHGIQEEQHTSSTIRITDPLYMSHCRIESFIGFLEVSLQY